MKRIIKAVSVLLIAALLIPLSFVSLAKEDAATIDPGRTYAKSGEDATVSLRIFDNPGISAYKIKISYPAELTFKGAAAGDALGGKGTFDHKEKDGVITVMWYRTDKDSSSDGEIAKLTFGVPASAVEGEVFALTVSFDGDDILNAKIEVVDATSSNGEIYVHNVHSFSDEWTIDVAPKVGIPGEKSHHCTVCGERRDVEEIPPLDPPPFVPGDVNGDGDVTVKDILKMRRYIAGLDELTEEEMLRGDINGDGDITVKDVLMARRIIAGLEI